MSVEINLSSNAIVVTGAAGGIGRAICARLAQAGASLLLSDIDPTGLEHLRAELALDACHDQQFAVTPADLSEPTVGEMLVANTLSKFGRIDAVVNAAAVIRRTSFLDVDERKLRESLDVNLASMFRICQAAVPPMVEAGGGTLVNFASPSAFNGGRIGALHYGMAKAGVITLTRGLCSEYGSSGIRSNVLCPGTTGTAMIVGALTDEQLEEHLKSVPMGRLADPGEIANAVLFLVSDLASFVNGCVLTVDGGASLRP